MNTYGRTILKFLLGWLKGATESFDEEALLTSSGQVGGWLGRYWLALVVILILVGVIADYVIWLIRWKPYVAWRSKRRQGLLRRSAFREKQFARGYQTDSREIKEAALPLYEAEPDETPEEPAWQERYLDWQFENAARRTEPEVVEQTPQPRRRRSEKYHRGLGGAVRNVRRRLYSEEDEQDYLVDGLDPIVSREDAFREPVYPNGKE